MSSQPFATHIQNTLSQVDGDPEEPTCDCAAHVMTSPGVPWIRLGGDSLGFPICWDSLEFPIRDSVDGTSTVIIIHVRDLPLSSTSHPSCHKEALAANGGGFEFVTVGVPVASQVNRCQPLAFVFLVVL